MPPWASDGPNFKQDLPTKLWGSLFHYSGGCWGHSDLVPRASACVPREGAARGRTQHGTHAAKSCLHRQGWGGQGCSRDSPIPILGLVPRCHRVDCATRPGAAALQDGETLAPQDGAGGGGTVCCNQGTHRSWHPPPPLHLALRAHTYCTTTLLVFSTVAADTCPLPMAGRWTG